MDIGSVVMWPIEHGIPLVFGWQPTPLVLSVGIIVYAWWRYIRGRDELDAFDAALDRFGARLASYGGDGLKFVDDVEALQEEFGDDRYIGHAWRGYVADLHHDERTGRVASGLPPSEFFNPRLFRQGRIDLRSFEGVPNQLVGLGLLATFLGLVAALFIARDGIQADLETSKLALRKLLGAAAAKFLTSVTALGASLIFAWRKNRRLHATELHIERINRELERLVLPLSSERLAAASVAELGRQTTQLERFNQDLAVSIAQALDERIGKTFATALAPVQDAIDGMAGKLGDINQSALERMAQQFAGELSGAAEEHTKRLGEMLETAAEAIGALPGQIDAAGESFRAGIEEGSKELATSFAAAGENLDASMRQSSDEMTNAVRQIATEVEAGAVVARRELEQAATGVGEAMKAGVTELSSSMIAAVDNLDARISEAGVQLSRSLDGAAGRIEASADSLGSVSERSAALAESLTRTSDALARQFEGALEAARGVTEGLGSLVAQVDKAGESAEALGALAASMTSVSERLERVAERVDEVADRADATNERSSELVEGLTRRVEVINRDLGALNNALSGAMQKLFEGLGSFGERTSGFVKSVDKELAEAVGRLSAAVQQLDEVLDDLPRRGDFKAFADAVSRAGFDRVEPAE
ncbi:methyl-accepting chemotaxis protein [Sphingomonas sp. BK235]|uniref:methyl-accepting chemotaxis protein n=1 Tax=Sphingomonas sp. BK235 TaxID=2512131 RepID=UPI0010D87759|nr:methyl-accepting chemotaxis protein [Sphingomonas sp. BK235]TCP37570.1 hypothetical protein EV292_1011094 [Sphingomonas sp. BK235]